MNLNDTIQTIMGKVQSWIDSLVLLLPNLAVAILVLILAWLGAKLASRVTSNLIGRVTDNLQIQSLLSRVAWLAVLIAGIFIALGLLQLDKTVTSLLAGVGILGLALGFAFQDLAANFMAGIIMAFRRPFAIGDLVETNGAFGKVKEVSLRSTVMTTLTGLNVEVPNKDVLGNPITNYTRTPDRRVDLAVGVSYGDDLEKAEKLAVDAVKNMDSKHRNPSREVELFYEEFGGSSINFTLRFWLNDASQITYLAARSDAIKQIKLAFDENGITIPFPIRTLDFGIVGGEKLSEMLPNAGADETSDSR